MEKKRTKASKGKPQKYRCSNLIGISYPKPRSFASWVEPKQFFFCIPTQRNLLRGIHSRDDLDTRDYHVGSMRSAKLSVPKIAKSHVVFTVGSGASSTGLKPLHVHCRRRRIQACCTAGRTTIVVKEFEAVEISAPSHYRFHELLSNGSFSLY